MLVGGGVQRQSRILRRPMPANSTTLCFLNLFLLLCRHNIRRRWRRYLPDWSGPGSRWTSARTSAPALRASPTIGDLRIGQARRSDSRRDTIRHRGKPAGQLNSTEFMLRDRRRHHRDSGSLKSPSSRYRRCPEGLHRRHRIGFPGRSAIFVQPWHRRKRRSRARPCRKTAPRRRRRSASRGRDCARSLDPEIGRQQSRKVGEIMQRRAADAPAALGGVGHRILAFEQDRRAREAMRRPHISELIEIGQLPVGAGFQRDHLLACLRPAPMHRPNRRRLHLR